MNISSPVADAIERIDFGFISTEEVRAVSVKRIQNDNTFDSLMLPVPDGLYDPALGAWGDLPCDTCHLRNAQCPGHPGHIELPVPVYHPVFMDQVLRLLRSQCIYCHGFRLSRKDVHGYICKFRLLQFGLLNEAATIDALAEDILGINDEAEGLVSEAEEEGNPFTDSTIKKRESFVRDALQRAKRLGTDVIKHEGATHMRRFLIKQFFADIVKVRRCATCQGISPTYRKDRFVKIFEKALSAKDQAVMARKNLKAVDAMAVLRKPGLGKEALADEEHNADIAHNPALVEGSEDGLVDEFTTQPRDTTEAQRYLDAMEVRARLGLLFRKEQDVLELLYNGRAGDKSSAKVNAEMFFLQAVLVPPNRFRPEARMGPDRISEAQQNSLYKNILRSSERVVQAHRDLREENNAKAGDNRSKSALASLHQAWTELQDSVNCLIDKTKSPVQGMAAQRVEDGIKQKLEKKEGLFRKNMMGKRVNYAARSVISPDPNIDTNEIGVPPVFATRLTYPEPVTSHNVRELAQAVINGAEKWPGASALENEAGQILNLRWKTAEERESLAHQLLTPSSIDNGGIRNKKVHRHLANGDVVLMNRQPTLHKPSIMGHRVRVLPGEKTIRMHYANCNTYNADFDGDEMNMHFPQNEVARAEALQLADTDHQYLSGTQGSPLRGLIQDHLSISVALCSKDTFVNRGDYHQLVYSALRPESGHILRERIELVPPSILKPTPLWTGKQVITTILLNITPPSCGGLWMKGNAKVKGSAWGSAGTEEELVIFDDGVFISGILDKSQLGPSSGGFIHAVHEVYGPAIAGKLLSSLGRLLTRTLHMRAFTCGMDDLTLTSKGELSRTEKLRESQNIGLKVASEYVGMGDQQPLPTDSVLLGRLEEVMRDDAKQEKLDMLMNGSAAALSTGVTVACLPLGLEKPFPKNHMQSMTTSGAKGSQVNANQISVNLGQQVLEGRRVPLMVNGRSLPCFKSFDTNLRAGGYIVNRFLTGVRPQEYFFHLMAGREGLIDTAVKTSRSGYLQRCIIKGMEGLVVAYDTTVRDSDGTLVQFLYGEDGLDITKQEYLEDFEFVLRNIKSQASQLHFGADGNKNLITKKSDVLKHMKSTLKHAKRGGDSMKDPANSLFNPARTLFATSENFFEAMSSYLSENKDNLIRGTQHESAAPSTSPKPSRKTAETLLATKFMRSLVEPGEAVGIVAGQSIGEPSTQMTLNTFHLAGHSAKNVTLGIPRLREILMTAAKNISTPSMTLLVDKELSIEEGQLFARSISVLPLSYVIDTARVMETVGHSDDFGLAKLYRVRLSFFPIKEIRHMYGIDISTILSTVENIFIPRLLAIIRKEIKKRSSQGGSATPVVGVRTGVLKLSQAPNISQAGMDDDGDDEGDEDATSAKNKQNRIQTISYGPNDDEDDFIQRQMAREASPTDDDDLDEEHHLGDPSTRADEDDTDDSGRHPPSERNRTSGTTLNAQNAEYSSRIRSKHGNITDFRYSLSDNQQSAFSVEFTAEYNIDTPKLLMVNLVRDAVKRSVIQQVQGLGQCTFVAKEKMEGGVEMPVIHTSGVNLRAMWQFPDFVDVDRIMTNDIATTLEEYGVEACRSNIIKELRGVFQSHNITVDNRHLNLIADYMTRNGEFTPFNRLGLAGNVSPFTKMSFETTVAFLRDALIEGDWDDLTTPSARIVVGKLGRVGTGAFDVLGMAPTRHLEATA
ncbi:hypothetical protein jhhlp_004286 [Lomentospora prolificans]|uniref:DNA-directed RNA polymerase subunit n=1 Tax=Lomentospora prolificans TaxID=41688 RepID=A0A2N3NB44_9PEZI|nr:hypothetical protein jhhlp_004286 [Lomentospora prolificans]